MILRELFYFDKGTTETSEDDSYDATRDNTVLGYGDNRKTRLSLGQINELRKAADLHTQAHEAELEFIARMYAAPPAA